MEKFAARDAGLIAVLIVATLSGCGSGGSDTRQNDGVEETRAWGTAQQLTNTLSFEPQIAVNQTGDAVVIWERDAGTAYMDVQAINFTTTYGWGNPILLKANDNGHASNPAVAVDYNGNAIAAWVQPSAPDDVRSFLWTSNYTPGLGWGAPELMETGAAGNAYSPKIAFAPSGHAIVAWEQSDLGGAGGNIWVNRYTPGTGWATARALQTENADAAGYVQLAVDENGNAVAVWRQTDASEDNIWAARYGTTSEWGDPILIDTNTGTAGSPQVAVDRSGTALAVWEQSDGTRVDIWSNRYTPGAGWGIPQRLESADGDAREAQVGLDPNGNAVAVWIQSDGIRDNVWANHAPSGGNWATPTLLETDQLGDAMLPQIRVDGRGNATVVWAQFNGTRLGIQANRYRTGSGWGNAESLESDKSGDAEFPRLAVDGEGNAITVWSQHGGTGEGVWINRFE